MQQGPCQGSGHGFQARPMPLLRAFDRFLLVGEVRDPKSCRYFRSRGLRRRDRRRWSWRHGSGALCRYRRQDSVVGRAHGISRRHDRVVSRHGLGAEHAPRGRLRRQSGKGCALSRQRGRQLRPACFAPRVSRQRTGRSRGFGRQHRREIPCLSAASRLRPGSGGRDVARPCAGSAAVRRPPTRQILFASAAADPGIHHPRRHDGQPRRHRSPVEVDQVGQVFHPRGQAAGPPRQRPVAISARHATGHGQRHGRTLRVCR